MNWFQLFVATLLLCVVVGLSLLRRKTIDIPEQFVNLLMRPTAWILIDDAQKNAAYVQVAIKAFKRTQGDDFDIKVVNGRRELGKHISIPESAYQLPANIWRLYAIASLLEAKGGLVMDGGSVLCVGPRLYPSLMNSDAAVFGTHPSEPIVSPTTASAPGPQPYIAWSSRPNHPAWSYASTAYRNLVAKGKQSWAAAEARHIELELWESQKKMNMTVLRYVDGSRLNNGKLRTLEDIFAVSRETALAPDYAFITYNSDDLARRHQFKWILNLSHAQLASSNMVWTKWAGL